MLSRCVGDAPRGSLTLVWRNQNSAAFPPPSICDHASFAGPDEIVAHCGACLALCSRTIRNAHSRTSAEYGLGRPIGSILCQPKAHRQTRYGSPPLLTAAPRRAVRLLLRSNWHRCDPVRGPNGVGRARFAPGKESGPAGSPGAVWPISSSPWSGQRPADSTTPSPLRSSWAPSSPASGSSSDGPTRETREAPLAASRPVHPLLPGADGPGEAGDPADPGDEVLRILVHAVPGIPIQPGVHILVTVLQARGQVGDDRL